MITTYVPKQEIVLKRNPNFQQWTPNSPNGHLDEIDIKIGVTPEAAVNDDDATASSTGTSARCPAIGSPS